MIRQDRQPRTDRQMDRNVPVGMIHVRENAMLLIRAREHITIKRCAIERASLPITVVVRLLRRAPITAHRHPARIEDSPALVHLMTDDRRQYAERQIAGRADANVAHYEIKKHIHASPYLRDAFKMLRRKRSGRGTYAHDIARQTRVAQTLGGVHATRAFLFG